MPTKSDNTQNIKSYMKSQDKNTGKPKSMEQKGNATKNQNTNTSTVKEASPNKHKQNYNTTKDTVGNKLPDESMETTTESTTPTLKTTSAKRNCSERSPLEGNPQKRQCENIVPGNTTELAQQMSNSQTPQLEGQPEGTTDTPTGSDKILEKESSINQSLQLEDEEEKRKLKESENIQLTQNNECNQNSLMQTILQELKCIKETIQRLDEKVDTSCENTAKHTSENTELKKLLTSQNNQIATLLTDNTILKQKNKTLEKDVKEMEDEMLRLKVDVEGIAESPYETYEHLRGKITEMMMAVCEGTTEQARWEISSNIPITDCRRIGTYKRNSKRPIRITFLFMKHKNCLLSRRSNLAPGVYVEDAFSESTKRSRNLLRPILKLAKSLEEYKGRCKLEKDELVLKGRHYKLETLNQLPENLAPYKTAQKSSPTCLVFQGLHSPLSNFHLSPFTHNGQKYHTAEHFIQYTKACHFSDYKTADKIKHSTDPYEAKLLSRNIENYDKDAWKLIAKEACLPGIKTKFEQNKMLLEFLKSTRPLQLAESSYDSVWGTGLPLKNTHSTDPTYWKNQGMLGEILMEIRDSLN